MVFETLRLIIRKATLSDADIDHLYNIWTEPRVMTMVGYPQGLRITRDDIRKGLVARSGSEFDCYLIVVLKKTGQLLGECKLGHPDGKGVSGTDVKLLPAFWGNKYGVEVKQGLLDYLFTHTDCRMVRATPNKNNIASQKMQKAVGGKRVGESIYRFPEKMRAYTCDVPHYIYQVSREDWERNREK